MTTIDWYRLAADGVVLLHFTFVIFVVAGGLLVLWRRGWLWLHLPAMFWGIMIEIAGWICPLTYLENYLRGRAAVPGYHGDFIAHYIMPLLYPVGLTREMQWTLAVIVIVVNLLVYWRVWGKYRQPR